MSVVTAKFTWTPSTSVGVVSQNLVVDGVAYPQPATAASFDLVVTTPGHHVADLTCSTDHATSLPAHVEFDTPDTSVPNAPTALAVNVVVA